MIQSAIPMPYRYLDDIATGDAAFEAEGETLEDLFMAAADATVNIMVEDLSTINKVEEMRLEVTNTGLDLLLYNFLNEIVFFKDARRLLLRVTKATVTETDEGWKLRAAAYGDIIDPARHPLGTDVKAVTLHRLALEEKQGGWKATVVLDT